MVTVWLRLYRTFPRINPALAKEQTRQSAGYQPLLTLLNDHHVLNYLRASPHTAWAGATLEDCSLNGQLLGKEGGGRKKKRRALWVSALVCCCRSEKKRKGGEGFSREAEHTRSTHRHAHTHTHKHVLTHLHSAHLHMKGMESLSSWAWAYLCVDSKLLKGPRGFILH